MGTIAGFHRALRSEGQIREIIFQKWPGHVQLCCDDLVCGWQFAVSGSPFKADSVEKPVLADGPVAATVQLGRARFLAG
jgi:hypothetical protein